MSNEAYQNALDQLEAYGLQVDTIVADGQLRRVKAEGDRGSKKSGWYVAHEFTLHSGRVVITGRFGNWKISPDGQEFRFDAKFTPEEREAAEKERQERQRSAAERAAEIWEKLPIEGHSDYLARKQIHGFGVRYSRGSVVVPVRKDGRLTGLQFIAPDGGKKFLTGTEKRGASFVIDGDDTRVLCEGYATGCSIAMATGHTVVVAFDAGNMDVLADQLVREFGDRLIIAADNDHAKPQNRGVEVAKAIGRRHPAVRVCWPPFSDDDEGTDFNDLHQAQGLDAVAKVIQAAKPQVSAPPEPAEKPAAEQDDQDWQSRLQRNKNGHLLPVASNVVLILMHDPAWRGCLSYCDFSYRIIKQTAPLPDMTEGEWQDADTSRLIVWLSNTYRIEPSKQKVQDAIIVAAQRSKYHPVRDYLESLQWDGTERLDCWMEDIYEANAGADYLQAVGRKFLIGAVARIMKPGCKMDNVLILEGRQGLRKSTSLAILFGDWFSDAPIPIGDKDAYQNIQGVWCSELAELDSFNKAESTSAKLFFSQVGIPQGLHREPAILASLLHHSQHRPAALKPGPILGRGLSPLQGGRDLVGR